MIVSNEPGYYKENEYGIRIENLNIVVPSKKFENFTTFENITMCPYDRNLIDKSLLNNDDI